MLRGLTWVAYGAALAPMFLVAYGLEAALLYLAVYGFELLLSVGHPRLMAMVLHEWKVPTADQPHLTRMSMLYAIATRVGLLLGAALFGIERLDLPGPWIGAARRARREIERRRQRRLERRAERTLERFTSRAEGVEVRALA